MITVQIEQLPKSHRTAIRDFYRNNKELNDDDFEKLFDDYFGCTSHYDPQTLVLEFTFTNENYTWFMLRW